jgi:hypothetical protein
MEATVADNSGLSVGTLTLSRIRAALHAHDGEPASVR